MERLVPGINVLLEKVKQQTEILPVYFDECVKGRKEY